MVVLAPLLLLTSSLTAASASSLLSHKEEQALLRDGLPQIGLYQALVADRDNGAVAAGVDVDASRLSGDVQHVFSKPHHSKFKAHCHPQPISHFATKGSAEHGQTFCQRYWFDPLYYKKGGPVIVLDGGETSGENRLPFLETGIIKRIAEETHGLPVILEHRYYGQSYPFGKAQNLSTDSLRFLNNAEALQDSARFIESVNFEGIEGDLTGGKGKKTPWIYYGGSYAGARAAHMRKLFPDLVYGAIASSAVTHAEVFYSDYMDAIRQWGPKECIADIESAILIIDELLDANSTGIKNLFGLSRLEDDDFASVLSAPLGHWQGRNWDPKVGSNSFYKFCDVLAETDLTAQASKADREGEIVRNYAKWIKHMIKTCPEGELDAFTGEKKIDVVACYGTHNDTKFHEIDLKQTWRTWLFQVCTEWGYFQGAPLKGPRIVSHRLTLSYTSKICKQAYPPGEFFQVPETPNISVVNDLGDYDIEMDRLAFIDGDSDPWRPATPQSDHAKKREDSILRPVKLIADAVHHYDENGLADPSQEPLRIQKIHAEEIYFVKEWLKDFKP